MHTQWGMQICKICHYKYVKFYVRVTKLGVPKRHWNECKCVQNTGMKLYIYCTKYVVYSFSFIHSFNMYNSRSFFFENVWTLKENACYIVVILCYIYIYITLYCQAQNKRGYCHFQQTSALAIMQNYVD